MNRIERRSAMPEIIEVTTSVPYMHRGNEATIQLIYKYSGFYNYIRVIARCGTISFFTGHSEPMPIPEQMEITSQALIDTCNSYSLDKEAIANLITLSEEYYDSIPF